MDIKQIIQQHGKSVAVVFSRYGINADVTERDLLLAIVMYKQPLIEAIAAQIETDESGFTGYEGFILPQKTMDIIKRTQDYSNGQHIKTLPTVTVTGKKKSKHVKDKLLGILGTLVNGAGAYLGSKPGRGNNQASTPAQAPNELPKKHKYILIGGIVLIVVLAIVVLTSKNK